MSYSISGIYKSQKVEKFTNSSDLRKFKLVGTEVNEEDKKAVSRKYLREILSLKHAYDNNSIDKAFFEMLKKNDDDLSNLKKVIIDKITNLNTSLDKKVSQGHDKINSETNDIKNDIINETNYIKQIINLVLNKINTNDLSLKSILKEIQQVQSRQIKRKKIQDDVPVVKKMIFYIIYLLIAIIIILLAILFFK